MANRQTVTNMVYINLTVLIITLNINGLIPLITKQRFSEWIKKYIPNIYFLQEAHLKYEDIDEK